MSMRTIVPSVRTFVLICLLLASVSKSHSQSITTGNGKIEFGLGFGPLFFLGDLGGNHGYGTRFVKDVNFPITKIQKGLYANIYAQEWLGFRIAINQGKLEGYDALINGKGGAEENRRKRNLEFMSTLWEVYGAVEFYPTVFMEKYDGLQGKFRPYGVVGVGAFKFNPKARYYGPGGTVQWVELKPLRLEGEGMAEYPDHKEFSLIAMEFPVGVGFKYYLKENMYVGLEIMQRISTSDKVDGVSTTYIDNNLFAKYLTPEQAAMANQLYFRENFPAAPTRVPAVGEIRGNPKQNDSYFSTILRLGWRLNENNPALRQLRCPSYY